MFTTSVVVLLLGLACLSVAATAALLGHGAERSRRIIERTSLTELGSWRPGRRRLAALGTTEFGPRGRQVAPISGRECTWYEAELVRMPPRGFDTEYIYEDTLWRNVSSGLATLADPSGRALISADLLRRPPNRDDPAITTRTHTRIEHNQLDRVPAFISREKVADTRHSEYLELREIYLAPGITVFAIGRAVRLAQELTLVASRGAVTILTSDPPDRVAERRRTDAAESRWLARGMLVAGSVLFAVGVAGMVAFLPTA